MTRSALQMRMSAAPRAFPSAATFGFAISLTSYISSITPHSLTIMSRVVVITNQVKQVGYSIIVKRVHDISFLNWLNIVQAYT